MKVTFDDRPPENAEPLSTWQESLPGMGYARSIARQQTMATTTTNERREQVQQEALSRAMGGQALTNWPAIFQGFLAKGIPEQDIRPRENVFTYHAWRALGRQVRRGEHGVKVITFVTTQGKGDSDGVETNDLDGTDKPKRGGFRRPWTATVFHVSQTHPIQP